MKAGFFVAAAGFMMVAIAGQAQSRLPANALGNLQVKEISIVEIDMSHVKVAADLAVTPTQTATLDTIALCSLRLNGLPVSAAPLNQETLLRKGVTTTLPPIYITLQFRDLDTVEPLRRMIAAQSVHVDGDLVADLHLNFLAKLALRTRHPRIAIELDQDVPALLGGTMIERNVAMGILSAIEVGMKVRTTAGQYMQREASGEAGACAASDGGGRKK